MTYKTLHDETIVAQFCNQRLYGRLPTFSIGYKRLFYHCLRLTVNFLPFAPGTP
jgi:hypothetical protein